MGNIISYSGEDDELEQIESITKSAEWKKKGDDYLEEGIYQEAADCYTESLNISTTYKCYTNRAYAYIKLGKFEEAISDSNLAIEMAPDAARAYQRRAQAYKAQGLHLLELSLKDYEVALDKIPESEKKELMDEYAEHKQEIHHSNSHNDNQKNTNSVQQEEKQTGTSPVNSVPEIKPQIPKNSGSSDSEPMKRGSSVSRGGRAGPAPKRVIPKNNNTNVNATNSNKNINNNRPLVCQADLQKELEERLAKRNKSTAGSKEVVADETIDKD